MGVVLKHPVIVFIICRCTIDSFQVCSVVGAVLVSINLYYTIAAYSILSAITEVNSHCKYLNSTLYILLAISVDGYSEFSALLNCRTFTQKLYRKASVRLTHQS